MKGECTLRDCKYLMKLVLSCSGLGTLWKLSFISRNYHDIHISFYQNKFHYIYKYSSSLLNCFCISVRESRFLPFGVYYLFLFLFSTLSIPRVWKIASVQWHFARIGHSTGSVLLKPLYVRNETEPKAAKCHMDPGIEDSCRIFKIQHRRGGLKGWRGRVSLRMEKGVGGTGWDWWAWE